MSKEEIDEKICNKFLTGHLQNSLLIRFLMDALGRHGCPMPRFTCTPCPNETSPAAAHFDPTARTISICQEAIQTAGQVEDAMAHELIHAFDDCRIEGGLLGVVGIPNDGSNSDSNRESICRRLACSEIRAATLSGDCKWTRELLRGYLKSPADFAGHFQVCIRRRAILSLQGNPACNGCPVDRIVDEVWEPCYGDTSPFIDIP